MADDRHLCHIDSYKTCIIPPPSPFCVTALRERSVTGGHTSKTCLHLDLQLLLRVSQLIPNRVWPGCYLSYLVSDASQRQRQISVTLVLGLNKVSPGTGEDCGLARWPFCTRSLLRTSLVHNTIAAHGFCGVGYSVSALNGAPKPGHASPASASPTPGKVRSRASRGAHPGTQKEQKLGPPIPSQPERTAPRRNPPNPLLLACWGSLW